MALMKKNRKKKVALVDGEPVYLDGFVPSSRDSHHSSLIRSWTWIGMGLLLASMAGFGTFIFGFAAHGVGGGRVSQPDGDVIGLYGLAGGLVLFLAGAWSIHHGRAAYRRYKEATGRVL